MSEINQKEGQAVEGTTTEKGLTNKRGVGELLRTEREKKGLTHQQVAEITRLRRHLIMALEKEEWDQLPAPVFVKGFIKSYAKALGLDEKKVLELYEEIPHVEPEAPRPIEVQPKVGGSRFLFPLVILAILVGLFFAWYRYSPKEKTKAPVVEQEKPVSQSVKKAEVSISKKAVPAAPVKNKVTGEASPALPQVKKEAPPVQKPVKEEQALVPKKEPAVFPEDKMRLGTTLESAAVQEEYRLVLNGFVRDRTWLSISIDGAEPKEYIFQPGSRPQWKAREGFDIVIGNAAGIEFDFNGKKIGNLGKLGQVVRLKLPERLQGTRGEE